MSGFSIAMPLKMRIYAEYLPDDFRMNDYMASNNERMTKALRNGGVHVLDIHTGFLNSAKRTSDTPLFFRLDQNWSPTGVLSAAETVNATLDKIRTDHPAVVIKVLD